MPFQSEKQRRYLHANHPEIAKRWERDYANGGISNHFRKKFDKGSDYGQFERRQAHNVAAGSQAMNVGGGQGNQGNGGGGPKPHSGPTLAEIEAQKKAAAAAALEKKNLAAWEHSQTLKQNKKERIKKTKYLKGLLKNDPLYDVYVAQGLLDWDNIKPYESDPRLKTDESLKAKQKGWWGYTRPYLGGGENLYISNLEEFGQEPKGPLHATRSGPWNETIAEKNKRIAETIGHEARHQVLAADVPQIIGDPYSGKVNDALYEQGFVDENTFNLPGKGTHELINTMADFQAYNNPEIYNDIYGTIHGDMPRHLSSPVADQLYDASTQFTKDTKARHEGEKYQNIDPIMIEGYADTLIKDYPEEVQGLSRSEVVQKLKQEADQMGTKGVMDVLYSDYLDNKEYAKGGVARKNYYHGGILDITGDEEITTDDGNDIELTAYNAAFDEPTGVKTLFQAKDGGTPQLAKKSKDGKRPGYQGPHGDGGWSPGVSHSGSPASSPSSDRGPRDDPDRFGQTTTTTTTSTGDGYQDRIIELQERSRKQALKDLATTGPGSDVEKYDTWDERFQNIPGTVKTSIYKNKVLVNKARDDWNKVKDSMNEKYKKKAGKKIIEFALTKGLTLGIGDIVGVMIDGFKTNKAKNEFIGTIKNTIANYKELGIPEHSPHTDTLIQTLNQELLDLTKKPEDDDTKGDGPEVPQVIPVGEEIDAYAQSDYYMSPWERIKANQAKRAMLVEKGIIQENPVVDESVTDITMEANRGGLANLFRVKNQ